MIKLNLKMPLILILLLLLYSALWSQLLVYIDQPDYEVPNDTEIVMSVMIDGATSGVGGYQVNFNFDPEYLGISGLGAFEEGSFLQNTGATEFLVAGENGSYMVGCAILGPNPGSVGSGVLFTVTLRALQPTGEEGTDVILTDVILKDPLNQEISVDGIGNSNVIINSNRMYCQIKAYLHGAYITGGSMRHSLTSYLPLTSPYNSSEVISVLPNVSPNYIVDWVYVQLRGTYNGPILQSQSCFILQDGTVVDTNGDPQIGFDYTGNLNHFAILRHRNHLGVMTAAVHQFSLNEGSAPLINMTLPGALYGGDGNAAKLVETSVYALYAGDASGDGIVANIDKVLYWRTQNAQFGYKTADYDLSGVVQNVDLVLYWRSNNGKISRIP